MRSVRSPGRPPLCLYASSPWEAFGEDLDGIGPPVLHVLLCGACMGRGAFFFVPTKVLHEKLSVGALCTGEAWLLTPMGTCGREVPSIATAQNRSPGSCRDAPPLTTPVRRVEHQFRVASSRPPSRFYALPMGNMAQLLSPVGTCGRDPASIAPQQNQSPGSQQGPPPVTLWLWGVEHRFRVDSSTRPSRLCPLPMGKLAPLLPPMGTCGWDVSLIAPAQNRNPGSCGDAPPLMTPVRQVEHRFCEAQSGPPRPSAGDSVAALGRPSSHTYMWQQQSSRTDWGGRLQTDRCPLQKRSDCPWQDSAASWRWSTDPPTPTCDVTSRMHPGRHSGHRHGRRWLPQRTPEHPLLSPGDLSEVVHRSHCMRMRCHPSPWTGPSLGSVGNFCRLGTPRPSERIDCYPHGPWPRPSPSQIRLHAVPMWGPHRVPMVQSEGGVRETCRHWPFLRAQNFAAASALRVLSSGIVVQTFPFADLVMCSIWETPTWSPSPAKWGVGGSGPCLRPLQPAPCKGEVSHARVSSSSSSCQNYWCAWEWIHRRPTPEQTGAGGGRRRRQVSIQLLTPNSVGRVTPRHLLLLGRLLVSRSLPCRHGWRPTLIRTHLPHCRATHMRKWYVSVTPHHDTTEEQVNESSESGGASDKGPSLLSSLGKVRRCTPTCPDACSPHSPWEGTWWQLDSDTFPSQPDMSPPRANEDGSLLWLWVFQGNHLQREKGRLCASPWKVWHWPREVSKGPLSPVLPWNSHSMRWQNHTVHLFSKGGELTRADCPGSPHGRCH